MVYQLIYTSSATEQLDSHALKELALHATTKNKSRAMTGLFLHCQGLIFQVLEGEKKDVLSLVKSIAADTRHKGMLVLVQREAERREFPGWYMGCKDACGIEEVETFFELTRQSLASHMPVVPSEELTTLTQSYIRASGL